MADPSIPRVRLDLTQHEPILDGVDHHFVFHAYPDGLPDNASVATYSIDELFAEKLRALTERTRPRDLYDVVFILENRLDALNLDRARALFREKCGVKSFPPPTCEALGTLIRASEELRSEWANMLAHQLPELPPLDSFLARIDGMLTWLDPAVAVPVTALPGVQVRVGQELVAAAGLEYWGSGVRLEAARFAGANRLLVEFTYNRTLRRVEPYSLRRARTGKLLLYGSEQSSSHIKAFDVSKMSGLRATGIPFTPRYRVEFMATRSISARPTRPRPSSPFAGSSKRRSGPAYIYECPYCGRRFEHAKRDPTLSRHKDGGGYDTCSGRRGTYVDTRYP